MGRIYYTLMAVICVVFADVAYGQEDTTAPVLLDFTISPVVFDTGLEM